jgi:hypothetical protein
MSRRAATLLSTVISLALAAMALAMALQIFGLGTRARIAQGHRAAALAACQAQIESLRAGGYARLPAGTIDFRSPDDPAVLGQLTVAAGPRADTRQVTALAFWPNEERAPGGQATLTAVFAARGLSP